MEGPSVSTQLYHRSGARVTLTLPSARPADVDAFVTECLQAGLTVLAPGLEEGENKDECGWVVRREKENQDKSITPIVDLYVDHEAMKHPSLSVYLNTEDEVAEFERASGMKLISLPLYEGEGRIERGKSTKLDAKVVRAPRPFGFVWAKNPKFDPDKEAAARAAKEVYPVARRKFVRWAEAKKADKPATNGCKDESAGEVAWWKQFFATDPPLDVVTRNFHDRLFKLKKEVIQQVQAHAIDPWKTVSGAEWDMKSKKWVPPRDPEPEQYNDPVPY